MPNQILALTKCAQPNTARDPSAARTFCLGEFKSYAEVVALQKYRVTAYGNLWPSYVRDKAELTAEVTWAMGTPPWLKQPDQ
jgi:hypothetical protein